MFTAGAADCTSVQICSGVACPRTRTASSTSWRCGVIRSPRSCSVRRRPSAPGSPAWSSVDELSTGSMVGRARRLSSPASPTRRGSVCSGGVNEQVESRRSPYSRLRGGFSQSRRSSMTSDAGPPGAPRFSVVIRGYDRRQVDEHVARLQRVIARMRADLGARGRIDRPGFGPPNGPMPAGPPGPPMPPPPGKSPDADRRLHRPHAAHSAVRRGGGRGDPAAGPGPPPGPRASSCAPSSTSWPASAIS